MCDRLVPLVTNSGELMQIPDAPRFAIHERAVLAKYDGDDQTKPPVEVLLLEQGQITGRWVGEEVAHAPKE